MNKTQLILAAVMKILRSPRNIITEEELKTTLGKSKSSFYRYIGELTEDVFIEDEPLLIKTKSEEGNLYSLNKTLFRYFVPEHLESCFYLEAYKKLGSLLSNENFKKDTDRIKDEVFQLNGRGEQLERKFYYLTKLYDMQKYREEDLSLITLALIENFVIGMRYNGKTYKKILPLTLCQYRDGLYLIAYKESPGEQNIRKFKLSRLESVLMSQEKFSYPPDWNPEDYFENSSGMMGGSPKNSVIRVYGHSRQHIEEREFFNKLILQQTASFDEYQLTYSSPDEFLGQLFVYAQDIEVISPQELKNDFVKKAEQALEINLKKAA